MTTSPVMLRKFDSGVKVIQNKSHSDDEVLIFFLKCSISFLVALKFNEEKSCEAILLLFYFLGLCENIIPSTEA